MAARYDEVSILDRPDESYATVQAYLNTGDEVEILERDGVWIRVATPDARTGWVTSMALELERESESEAQPD